MELNFKKYSDGRFVDMFDQNISPIFCYYCCLGTKFASHGSLGNFTIGNPFL